MEKTIYFCDICEKEIESTPFTIKAHDPVAGKEKWKKIGCDMVLTPRGDRFYVGQAMMRINTNFYCGVNPGNVDKFHFHAHCIKQEIYSRLSQFLFNKDYPPIEEES